MHEVSVRMSAIEEINLCGLLATFETLKAEFLSLERNKGR